MTLEKLSRPAVPQTPDEMKAYAEYMRQRGIAFCNAGQEVVGGVWLTQAYHLRNRAQRWQDTGVLT